MTVGRLVPNKRIDEVLRTFACYERTCAPGSRLAIVGGDDGFEAYGKACRRLAETLGIRDPFVGAIDDAAKQELLARASAYLVCSEHEGFCVPLVEAMRHDLPIVARAFGAVPETLGGAGIAAPPEAGPAELAELLHLAVTDPSPSRRDGRRPRRAARRARARAGRRASARRPRRPAVKRVAFVVPRYGAEIGGGAEEECRRLAELLAADLDVTVLTSCALDYRTWADHYPPGEELVGGVRVLRFPVSAPRDLAAFDALSGQAYARPDDLDLGRRWMRAQGPDVPGIAEHLRVEGDAYDAVCVLPYLYATAPDAIAVAGDAGGARAAGPRRAAAAARDLRRGVRAAGRAGVQHAGGARGRRGAVRRRRPAPVHDPAHGRRAAAVRPGAVPGAVRHRRPVPAGARPDRAGQGLGRRAGPVRGAAQARPDVRLVLVGRPHMTLPADLDGVVVTGYVDEQTKHDAIAGAAVVLLASPYESLSIVALEAWSHARPTLANAASDVLVGQSRRSGGGLWYADAHEFHATLALLLDNPPLAAVLGAQGPPLRGGDGRLGGRPARLAGGLAQRSTGGALTGTSQAPTSRTGPPAPGSLEKIDSSSARSSSARILSPSWLTTRRSMR